MITLSSIGIHIDRGVITPFYRKPFELNEATISIDLGVIPYKNYFPTKIDKINFSIGPTSPDMILLQVI